MIFCRSSKAFLQETPSIDHVGSVEYCRAQSPPVVAAQAAPAASAADFSAYIQALLNALQNKPLDLKAAEAQVAAAQALAAAFGADAPQYNPISSIL